MMTTPTPGREPDEGGPARPPAAAHAALLSLRAQAEKRRHLVTESAEHQSPQQLQRLVQELQVHQIELEMRYEELLVAQADAQTARAQYVDLYDFAPLGYFNVSAAGLIQQLNLCASQLLGAGRQRLLGRRFARFVAPDSRFEFGQFLVRALNAPRSLSCELVLQREDGTPFHAQIEGLRVESPLENAATPQCRLAVIDISARRRATDALAASEARFRRLFTESNDAVMLLQGFTYVDCNHAALRLLGATHKSQLVGQKAWSFAPDVQPDGRRTADLFRSSVEQVLRSGSLRCDALMRKVTGEEMWIEAVLTPIEEEDGQPLVHILWRDVTAERRAAEQLRESEARLNLALDASETGIFTWNLTARELELDARAQAVFGFDFRPGSLPSEALGNRIHPDDGPRVWATIRSAIATRAPLTVDYRVVWPDGSVHYASSAGRALTDAQGRVLSFAGVLRDVTALYAAQEELHNKSLVLERLLDNMPVVLSRIRPDGEYLELAGAGLRLLGVADNALVGHNVLDEFPVFAPFLPRVLSGEPSRFTVEMGTAEQPLTYQNYGFFDEHRQQAMVLSVDVTVAEQQRKQLQAEKEFTEKLLENSLDGIIALDHDARVTAWNSRAAHYFGHTAAAALGQPAAAVLPHLDPVAAQHIFERVLAGETLSREGQAFPHGAGHYDVNYVPLKETSTAAVTGVLIMFRDVTERDRLAEEATQLRLRQQQEVLSAVLNTQEVERKRIAEALHNGLGQILYATKLSLEAPGLAVPPAPRQSLKLLNEAIRTTRTISFELTPGILEDFGLRIALEELVKRIAPAGLPVHLHLSNLEQRLRPQVEISVYRIVQELLNNAMKHAKATEVVVHVAHEKDRVEVSVEDNGAGFEPAVLDNQPLMGMGLSGVRNRVALLGGQLSIQSRPGLGTIVSFELNA